MLLQKIKKDYVWICKHCFPFYTLKSPVTSEKESMSTFQGSICHFSLSVLRTLRVFLWGKKKAIITFASIRQQFQDTHSALGLFIFSFFTRDNLSETLDFLTPVLILT